MSITGRMNSMLVVTLRDLKDGENIWVGPLRLIDKHARLAHPNENRTFLEDVSLPAWVEKEGLACFLKFNDRRPFLLAATATRLGAPCVTLA
eukprot:14477392-Heterocapsa_arctica.AAC.1